MDVKKILVIGSLIISVLVYKNMTLKVGPSAPEMEYILNHKK